MKTRFRLGRYPVFAALVGLVLLPGPAAAQEAACPQREPKEGSYSRSANDYMEQAREQDTPADRRGYFNFALGLLKQGIAEEPENPLYYLMAGQAYLEVDDYVGADSVWDRAECLWQPYAQRIEGLRLVAWSNAFTQAQELVSSGDSAAAMHAYRNAYAIYDEEPYPVFQVAVYNVGQAQVVEGDSLQRTYLEDAIWAFRESIAASRRSDTLSEEDREDFIWSATANLAQVLAFQGRLLDAAEVYEQFLEDHPGSAEARSSLATFLAMQFAQLQDSLQVVQDSAEQAALLAQIDSLGARVSSQYSELLGMEEAGLEADEYHQMGIGLYQLDRLAEAAIAFRKALELEPYRPESLELLAHGLYASERFDTLVAVAGQLVERYPYNLEDLLLLAHACRETDDRERALEVLQRREALPFQLVQLNLQGGAAFGQIENLKLEPGTLIEIEFGFYDDSGNVVGSGRLSMNAPAQGELAPFRVTPEEAASGVSGVTYRVVAPS